MAVLWFSGGETGGYQETGGTSSGGSVATDQARSGTYSYKFPTGALSYRETKTGFNASTIYFGFGFRYGGTITTAQSIIAILNSSDLEIGNVIITTAGKLQLVNSSTGSRVNIGSPNGTLSSGTWYYLEVKCVISAGSGIMEVKIDGTVDQTVTSLTNNARGNCDRVGFGMADSSAGTDFWFDDLIASNSGYLVNPTLFHVRKMQFTSTAPNANGWTKSTGSTIDTCWNDTPFSTGTSANSGSTTGAIAQTAVIAGSTPWSSGDIIIAAKVNMVAKTSATTSSGGLGAVRRRVGSTNTDTNVTITTGDVAYETAIWVPTVSELSTMEAGWNKRASTAARTHTVEDGWIIVAFEALQTLTPALYTNTPSFYTHVLEGGAQAITQTGSALDFNAWAPPGADSGTVSTTITVPDDADFVLVAVTSYETGATHSYSGGSMTFTKGGVDTAMTSVTGNGDADFGAFMGAMFYLVAPDTGSNKTLKWDLAGVGTTSDDYGLVSVTFWKGVNQADPVRDGDGEQSGSISTATTPTLTCVSGDLIVAFGYGFTTSGLEATIDSWSNLTLLSQSTHNVTADGAWATGSPSGDTTVGITGDTGFEDGGIVAVVLKPAAGAGDQALTASLYSNTHTYYTHTLSVGAVDLTPNLYTSSPTFYTHTLAATYALVPSLYTNDPAFFTHVLAPGAVTLVPSLYTNDPTFFTHVLSTEGGPVTLEPSLFTNTQSFPTHTLTPGEVALTAPLHTNAQGFFTQTLTSVVALSPEMFTNTAQYFLHAISVGEVTLTASLFTNSPGFFTHTVDLAGYISPELYMNTSTFYAATLSPGGVTLESMLYTNVNSYFEHAITADGAGIGGGGPWLRRRRR